MSRVDDELVDIRVRLARLEERTTELEHGYVRLGARLEVTIAAVKAGATGPRSSAAFEEQLEQAELDALEHFTTTGRFRGRR